MSGPSIEVPRSESPTEKRLDSWKEIAAYLNRDVTTVQRWEKREGMPVYRHVHDKRGSVYALPDELDAWREHRRPTEFWGQRQRLRGARREDWALGCGGLR